MINDGKIWRKTNKIYLKTYKKLIHKVHPFSEYWFFQAAGSGQPNYSAKPAVKKIIPLRILP